MQRITQILILLLLTGSTALCSQPALTGRLDNGMEVVLLENHAAPMIAMNIVIFAGAREESWDTWGASHFLEHLLFNGTETRTQEELYAEFDRIGAYNNAHTASHFTDFMLVVSQDNFPVGFEIMTDMIFNSTLPVEKFEKERGIVIEEMARSASMGYDADNRFEQMLFGASPLSRNVLGSVASISHLERDSVLAFYQRWYVPNNMMLFATGRFDADSLYSWLQDKLSDIKPHDLSPRRQISEPDYGSLAGLGIVHVTTQDSKRSLQIASPAPLPGDPDYPAFQLLVSHLDRSLSNALPSGCRTSSDVLLDPDFAVLQTYITCAEDGPDGSELERIYHRTLAEISSSPLTQQDVERLSRSYYADRVFSGEMLSHYGIMNAAYWSLASWEEFTSWPERMNAITPDEISATAGKWLTDVNRFVMCLEPGLQEVDPDTSADKEYSDYTTENGLRIIGIEDRSAQIFAMHILVKDRWKYDFRPGAVDLLHRTLAQTVTKGYESLDERLDELGARIKFADNPMIPFDDYYTSPAYSYIRLEVLPDKWQEGIELIGGMLKATDPGRDQINSAKQGVNSALRSRDRNAARRGIHYLRQKLIPAHYLSSNVYGDVTDLNTADITDLQKKYFVSPNMTVTWVGPVNAGDVETTIAEVLDMGGNAASGNEPGMVDEQFFDSIYPVADTLRLGLPQGALVTTGLIEDVDPEDQAAIIVANAFINDRISTVIREEMGLAYSLGSSFSNISLISGKTSGLWEITISTRSENLATAHSALNEVLDEAIKHKFDRPGVEKLANAIAGRLLMRNMSRIGQAYSMGLGEFSSGDPLKRMRLIDELKAVTGEEVEAALNEYFNPEAMSVLYVE